MTTIEFKNLTLTKTDADELMEYCMKNKIPHTVRMRNDGTIISFKVDSSREDMVDKKMVTTQLNLAVIEQMIESKGLTRQ